MKREGRQHGMVQAWDVHYPEPPWRRIINVFSSPTTRRLCTKVATKPNNHSKYTSRCRHRSRCGGCHINPPCKSLLKVKGLYKVRSAFGMWRFVDGFRGLKLSGFSASEILDYLDGDNHDIDNFDHDDDVADHEYFGFDEDHDGIYNIYEFL
ncbi:uncharacterized protein [Henckelia pumila]|uniref:uncharacterized protein n=1 Tax=Henckelia pumila TaxID=405737 RepID=UPI003C6DEC7A